MPKHILDAKKRDLSQNINQIRNQGVLPANVFEPHEPSQAIALNLVDFENFYSQIGESGVGYLKLKNGTELPVMIEEVQTNPVTDQPIHALFQVVDLTEKVRADIPVELVGEFEIPEAVLVTVRDEIEVEAFPTDLPEKFEINVANFTEIGQSFALADLEYDAEKIKIILGDEGWDEPVVLVQEVEEEPEEPEEPIETEIIGEEDEVEGEEIEGEEGEEVAAEPEESDEEKTEAAK